MKKKRICILFFSLCSLVLWSQTNIQKTDSLKTEVRKYQPNFMAGVDLLNLGTSFFSERKMYQGFVSTRFSKKLHLVADLGYDRNVYQKNSYNALAKGPFLKLGAFYMLAFDKENPQNGFYAGGKIAGSFYKQQYFKVPIRGSGGGDFGQAFPQSSQSSYWVEGVLGGRVQLFESRFFIDVTAQPRYLVATTKQEEIFPMIVPGFGKSSSRFSMGFTWNLAYEF